MELQAAPSTNALKFPQHVSQIGKLMKGTAANKIQIGRTLKQVQAGFRTHPGGNNPGFKEWLEYNFHLSPNTAYRYIDKALKFHGIAMSTIENMHPTALTMITTDACPDEVTEIALAHHCRVPINNIDIIQEIMREYETQKQLTQSNGPKGLSTQKKRPIQNVLKYIWQIDPVDYTDDEKAKIIEAVQKKLNL